jgi:AcrR family transcriptional regulator
MVTRDAKKAATRLALADAALDLFEERGFAETTMADVAAAAGVSRPTAFRHFASKAELVLSVQDEWLRIFATRSERHEAGERWWDTLTRLVDEIATYIESQRKRTVRAYRLVQREPLLQAPAAERDRIWVELIAELSRPHTDASTAQMASGAVMGMITSAFAVWARRGGRDSLRALLDQGFALLGEGMHATLQTRRPARSVVRKRPDLDVAARGSVRG